MRITGGQVFDLEQGFVSRDVCFDGEKLELSLSLIHIWMPKDTALLIQAIRSDTEPARVLGSSAICLLYTSCGTGKDCGVGRSGRAALSALP